MAQSELCFLLRLFPGFRQELPIGRCIPVDTLVISPWLDGASFLSIRLSSHHGSMAHLAGRAFNRFMMGDGWFYGFVFPWMGTISQFLEIGAMEQTGRHHRQVEMVHHGSFLGDVVNRSESEINRDF